MSNKVTNNQIFSSLFWKVLERGGAQGVSFIVSIILARLLTPKEYGVIAIVLIFINLANIFVQSGFNTSLIQKRNVDNLDYSTVFIFSLFLSAFLYVLLYFSSPTIAEFYAQPLLVPVIRVLALTLFFGSVNSIQIAIASREMQFKKLFYSNTVAVFLSGAVGIILAYNDFGVWALVGQQLTMQIVLTIVMWFSVNWRPQIIFSFERLRGLFSYGWKILLASFIDGLYVDLRTLVIGRFYTPADVGFYDKGKQFPTVIVNNLDGSIQSVMLPTYASFQDDKVRVKNIMKRSISTSSYIVMPMMVGLAIVAEPMVNLILTETWLPIVPILRIYCIIYGIRPILTANTQAIKGLGHSDIFLKVEFLVKSFSTAILILSLNTGIVGIAWGVVLSNLIALVIYTYPNSKLIDYHLYDMIKDILPSVLLSLAMGILIYPLKVTGLSSTMLLLTQVLIGTIIYLLLSIVFKVDTFTYLVNMLKSVKKK